ncbi:Flavoprotein oxygenase [Lasiodiplodia theobromae]|uniref:Flavoprotein oxygenase n=1 Tax=Lasiodiplodia theobromae TaxID=45133 RepID=UPI0015C2D1E7|nr:Flavoprotein oxygenase [Lasiodiplodia theobromae]KAF4545453.1 Flavoprotein oxygenase [Lasiodiplodia theobromae]
MASIHDRFQVPTDPAVITPFEDVDDPLADADVPVASIERDDSSYYIFGPPSQSSDGRYTTRTRSSIGGRGRRFSNHTQLTEPSSISDMPSDCFPLEKQKRSIAKAMPPTTTVMAMARTSSPAISPTTTHRDITAYRNGVASKPKSHHHSSRPRPRRNHHTTTTTAIDTPTRFHPEPTPTYSPYHSRTPSSSSSPHRAPLILLHVTLLPSPALPYPPHLLRRVLPRSTMRAYAQLEERLADPVLMTRGLLVAHPREEMDVLEERVLEGLELRAPRVLKCGHFYHVDDYADDEGDEEGGKKRRDSGVDAEADAEVEADAAATAAVETDASAVETASEAEEEITCTECHAHLPLPPASSTSATTRWTIKIYAANGLLAGPGAWSAAWSEMERVDVAITPYLSPAQHRALQAAVREEEQAVADAAARAAEERADADAERDALLRAAEEAGRREAEAEAEARAEEVRREAEGRLEEAEARAEQMRNEAEERLEAERMEAEARLEAERTEAEARLEAERVEAEEMRKEVEERLELERMEAEERLEEEKQERLRLIGSAALAAAAERRAAEERVEEAKVQAVREERKRVREERARRAAEAEKARMEVPLATLVRRALWVAAVDWRNVLIVVLGAWLWMVGSGAVVPQEMGTELDVSGVFFDAAVSPFFDNATVEQQFEVVRTTETVTATATATQTSTAIVTAFVLETLAPQALEQSASTTTADLSEPTDTPDAVNDEYKDAVFAATTEILASAFEKMDAIIAALVEAYKKSADDEDASAEAQPPRTDVCSTIPELAYPTCAVDDEVLDVEQVEEDPRPRTCANRELEVEYFNRAAPTCSVHLVWV